MRFTDALVLLYLAAIATANIVVTHFGPPVAVLNAFLFIGLDLSVRDRLHALWQGRALWPRMLVLIAAGGLLSLLLGGSGRIAVASSLAFVLAGAADAAAFHHLRPWPWLWRANGSNLVSAAIDSACFAIIAFGPPVLWSVVLGQLAAKLLGGAIWAWVLSRHRPVAKDHFIRRFL